MMDKLGVAVIGTGFWGRNHARVFKELPMTELVAVCDIDYERANTVARQFGVKAYTSPGKMLRRKDIEAVSICTWSTSLAKEALRALKAGKHVLVEKPMAANSKCAEALLKCSESNGLLLTVGFLMRFIPGIQYIKEAFMEKRFGEIVCATAKRVSQWPERIGDVGVVKDLAIHDIDMMRYLFNENPVAVYAKAGSLRHSKFEDYAHIMLTFDGNKNAFIEANWLTPYKTRTLVITSSEAIIKLDYITQELSIERAKESVQPRIPWQEPLKLELEHFVNCVLGKAKPLITGWDGLMAIKIAEAALKSSKTGKLIKIRD
ncbi:MAG: Gfo/Idh/MocA family oxidoreductase [Candidatus Bathyarchaeota archaeon]|nr:Gfo/Idh/MocA family oxidoreductase [Candidatus Bathyarchaeota archaeon]MCX8177788.1 Gfo/Idh/MocA family oxidoreductase [Candidatus Bathyarchaeota archaeon]MDW8194041.1 Gfo/Idh/MocA family oxidoreductase [Nitrososphaerota archaeon]